MFSYCNNNPVNYIDSAGSIPIPLIIGISCGLVSAGITWMSGGDIVNIACSFGGGFVAGLSGVCGPFGIVLGGVMAGKLSMVSAKHTNRVNGNNEINVGVAGILTAASSIIGGLSILKIGAVPIKEDVFNNVMFTTVLGQLESWTNLIINAFTAPQNNSTNDFRERHNLAADRI